MAGRRLSALVLVFAAACDSNSSKSGNTGGRAGESAGGQSGAGASLGGSSSGNDGGRDSSTGGGASGIGRGGADGARGGASSAGSSGAARGGSNAGGGSATARGGGSARGGQPGAGGGSARGGQSGTGGGAGGHWKVQHVEDFSSTTLPATAWAADPVPDDGPFADQGVYFTRQNITAPKAFRVSQPFGEANWLTLESYTRDSARALSDLASVVADPAGGSNKVLRIRSPKHTDATVIRSSAALPNRYRISVRVGYASFGDGSSERNGYDSGDETAEPWLRDSAVSENGFYWLTILDSVPRPHNNVWIHHHRKVCIDSDNTTDGWMSVWNGTSCETSGAHPIMMFALDGASRGSPTSGKSFLSYRGGKWGTEICAVDAYRAERWYQVSIERFDDRFTLSLAGDFINGGTTTYTASIDAAAKCVFHYNNQPLASDSPCSDDSFYAEVGASFPNWPSGVAYPDYFMFGEPHENFYEGTVYYDDVKLEVWEGE